MLYFFVTEERGFTEKLSRLKIKKREGFSRFFLILPLCIPIRRDSRSLLIQPYISPIKKKKHILVINGAYST